MVHILRKRCHVSGDQATDVSKKVATWGACSDVSRYELTLPDLVTSTVRSYTLHMARVPFIENGCHRRMRSLL